MHWGDEALIPVACNAGALDQISKDRPLISYPEQSYLGQVLACAERAELVRPCEGRPICDTKFSAAAKNMVLNGLGMAWLPLSLVHDEIAAGQLEDLSSALGQVPLDIALYARPSSAFDADFVVRAAARLSAN